MIEIVFETGSYVWAVAGFRSKQDWTKDILPKFALFFDKIHFFGDIKTVDLFEQEPFADFSNDMTKELFSYLDKYSPPTEEQLKDLAIALGDDPGSEGGIYAYYGTRATLDYCEENNFYFYVLPGLREKFIEFCLKYHPTYLDLLKKSFLLCDLIEFIFEHYIPAFDILKAKESIKNFSDYKIDFQLGVLSFLNQFEGGYSLSESQIKYLNNKLANDERRLFEFLKPENLKKFDISLSELGGEGLSHILSLFSNALLSSIPIGLLISIIKEIKELREFKNEQLEFILSLTILKKITNKSRIIAAPNCVVCNISLPEIEQMSDEDCMKLIYENELCIEHMVARLDLKKRFKLWGKNLLKTMKKLGDSSVFIDINTNREENNKKDKEKRI